MTLFPPYCLYLCPHVLEGHIWFYFLYARALIYLGGLGPELALHYVCSFRLTIFFMRAAFEKFQESLVGSAILHVIWKRCPLPLEIVPGPHENVLSAIWAEHDLLPPLVALSAGDML